MTAEIYRRIKIPAWLWPENKQIVASFLDVSNDIEYEISTTSRFYYSLWRFFHRNYMPLEYREIEIGK